MSEYPPPLNINPIFNPYQFSQSDSKLTIGTADVRYLKLAGGTETGIVSFNEPIRLSNDVPALSFQSDTDSGLRWTADGDMALMSNNSNALRIWPSGVASIQRPFYVSYSTAGSEPFFMLEGVQQTSLLSASTTVTQKASASDRSCQFRNTSSSLGASDIAFRFLSLGASTEVQINRNAFAFLNGGCRVGSSGTNIGNINFGSVNYTGNINNGSGATTSTVTLTGFTATPTILITPFPNPGNGWYPQCYYCVVSPTSTSFQVNINNLSGNTATGTVTIYWLAIGS